MKQYINKFAVVAEIKRITNEQQEICKADVALGKAPDSKNIEVIYQFQQFTKFLDTLEVKEVDLEKIKRDWRNKGYIEGRKQALIPARKLGLPKSLNIIDMKEVKAAAKAWSEDDENTRGCDYIGATVAERAFAACAEWLINKAQKGE